MDQADQGLSRIPRLQGAANYQRWLARMEPYLAFKGVLYTLKHQVDIPEHFSPMDWRGNTPIPPSPNAEVPLPTIEVIAPSDVTALGVTYGDYARDHALCIFLIRSTLGDTPLD